MKTPAQHTHEEWTARLARLAREDAREEERREAIRRQRLDAACRLPRSKGGLLALFLNAAGVARRRGDKAMACQHLEAYYREALSHL